MKFNIMLKVKNLVENYKTEVIEESAIKYGIGE